MPITSKQFKNVLGCFATGVAIVTTSVNGKIHGLTVNSFTSVSLKPPLVLICIDTKAESCKLCLLYTSQSKREATLYRNTSSA